MSAKLERSSTIAQRIVNDEGTIIAWALKLSNGLWALFNENEVRLTRRTHGRASGVLKEWNDRNTPIAKED